MRLLPAAFSAALLSAPISLAASGAFTGAAAQSDVPQDGGYTLRQAVTPVAEEIHTFHNWIMMPVMVGISLFVLALLVWVVLRFNAKANPVAKQFSHNTLLEVVWTAVPVMILLFIALFSFDLLYIEDKMPDGQVAEYEAGAQKVAFPNDFAKSRMITNSRHLEVSLVDQSTGEERLLSAADDFSVDGFGDEELVISLASPVPAGSRLKVVGGRSRMGKANSTIVPAPTITIKATGFQWGWTYNYPDFGDFEFDALMAARDTVPSELYRLATTNDVVVPAGETVRVVTTGRDVIHAWSMSNFGVKIDAIPGRLNETWFYTEQEGLYYGQCAEICGIDHAFMPISVRVVSRPEFEAWVDEQRELNGMDAVFGNTRQVAAIGADVAGQ